MYTDQHRVEIINGASAALRVLAVAMVGFALLTYALGRSNGSLLFIAIFGAAVVIFVSFNTYVYRDVPWSQERIAAHKEQLRRFNAIVPDAARELRGRLEVPTLPRWCHASPIEYTVKDAWATYSFTMTGSNGTRTASRTVSESVQFWWKDENGIVDALRTRGINDTIFKRTRDALEHLREELHILGDS